MKNKITLIQVLFLCVFIGCAVFFISRLSQKNKTETEMQGLQDLVQDTGETEEYDGNGMLMRYRNLYDANNDMVGWLRVEGTCIDYPVLYKNDSNAYYLHRNFERQNSEAGIPFLDYQCAPIDDCTNLIIYGHNMRNGTMFHELLNYKDKDFWEKNKYIRFDTLYDRRIYEIFAVFHVTKGSGFKYYEFIRAENYEGFDSFISACKGYSLYDTGITPLYGDKLLTLSTCSYNSNDERFVVIGREISRE